MSPWAACLSPLPFVAVALVAALALGLVGASGGAEQQPSHRTTTPWHGLQGYTPEDYIREFGRKYRSCEIALPSVLGFYWEFLGAVVSLDREERVRESES